MLLVSSLNDLFLIRIIISPVIHLHVYDYFVPPAFIFRKVLLSANTIISLYWPNINIGAVPICNTRTLAISNIPLHTQLESTRSINKMSIY